MNFVIRNAKFLLRKLSIILIIFLDCDLEMLEDDFFEDGE